MMDTRVAIIDDFEAACNRLTPLGRYIIGNACLPVREAVLSYARRTSVRIFSHCGFQAWATELLQDRNWYSLDPFLAAAHHAGKFRSIRTSRVLMSGAWVVDTSTISIGDDGVERGPISLIDDAAVSGNTLLEVIALLLDRGATSVERIALCAATKQAAMRIASELPTVKLENFNPGSYLSVHMRDACPYMPFSGRPSPAHEPVRTVVGTMGVRMPTMSLKGPGPWQPIFSDFTVLHSVIQARVRVNEDLSRHLGRPATVEDLTSLGADVVIPAYPRHVLRPDTELSAIT